MGPVLLVFPAAGHSLTQPLRVAVLVPLADGDGKVGLPLQAATRTTTMRGARRIAKIVRALLTRSLYRSFQ